MEHVWHKCDKEDCTICLGELKLCVICGQAEGTLEPACPGAKHPDNKILIRLLEAKTQELKSQNTKLANVVASRLEAAVRGLRGMEQ
jgi:hypothetical protein